MTSKKLGDLLRSVPPATAGEAKQQPPATAPAPVVEDPTLTRKPPPIGLFESEVPLQVLIPASIRKQLAFKAAEEGQSLRALVLRAIRSLGVTVTEADIKGKRGRRNA
jgi:hypothetical protein